MAGRPTKYSEEMLAKANEYIANCEINDRVPTAAGMAKTLDVNKSTLYEWAKQHTPFSNTLSKLNDYQEDMLIQGGLTNKLNPTITKLMLANHGYTDKQDITSGGDKIGAGISAEQAEQLIRARADRSNL